MKSAVIKIVSGSYRNQDVSGKVFPLVKPFQMGANGGFVTVDASKEYGADRAKIRVKVSGPKDIEYVEGTPEMALAVLNQGKPGAPEMPEVESTETDEEIIARIAKRFDLLHEMTKAAIAGHIRAMIVTGPPGVGKSFGVEYELEKASLFDKISNKRVKYEVVKGATTAIGLYCTLFKYSDPGSVLVFDDCDTVLFDDTSLNLLKGALDSGKKRRISWNADSNMLRKEGVPDQFDFKGTVIFITNLKFDNVRSNKLRDHLDALQSRCHFLDLTLNTMRDKYLRIKQIAATGELFAQHDISKKLEARILEYMNENRLVLREMSLRTAVKIADLAKSFPDKWEDMAKVTVMRPA